MSAAEKAAEKPNGKTHRMVTSLAGTDPRVEVRKITPELAKRWLTINCPTNRKLSVRSVEAYAREMSAGRWQLTHQAIAFNQTGELIDGQHRLAAVVESGATIHAYVSTGLPLEYNAPIDQGYGRRVDQIMGKSPRYVSVVRGMYLLEKANLGLSFKTQVGMIEELAERHGASVDQVLLRDKGEGIRTPAGFLSVCAFAFPVEPDKIVNFVEQVNTGEMLVKGEPAYVIRRWFLRGERHSTKENMIASANAVRHLVLDKPMEKVFAGGGDEKEGLAGYLWICQRRRKLRLTGTPTADEASFDAMADANAGRTR